jgi:uncharacterized protein YbjT (DUF2867 family)
VNKLALVTGATGQQGGAVAARLLADGWRVRALTRDTSSAKAQALAAAGAEVVTGDLEDRASISDRVPGAYAVFSVHPGPLAPGQDELRAGKNVADVALAHGVTHLVYSSGLGADTLATHGLQQDKWNVEQHIRALGVSATILRPASFMENYFNPLFGLRDGALRTALAPDTRQQLIALDDIAALTALAFENPDDYRGRTLELAGDALVPAEVAAAISKAVGRTVPYDQLSIEELRRINERFARGYELLNTIKEPTADLPELRRLHPGLLTFAAWLDKKGASKIKELVG